MAQQIPILDLNPEIQELLPEFMAATERVLKSGQFIMGPDVVAFEKEVAAYLGVKHAISCNSGTDALVIGLRAAGIGPGDEVITSPFTFFATAESISAVGATPVFVDIDPETYNLDVALASKAVTSKTKAIIPVHLYGHAADMDAVMLLARRHGLKVIEDVAQAFGAQYSGRQVGTIGDVGAFSFFPSKNLGCFGDGGLITTDDDALADSAKMLRVHGSRKKYYNEEIGYNSRLDSLQAAYLRIKLTHIDKRNAGRRQVAQTYNELLSGSGFVTPVEKPGCKHVYHQYTVRVPAGVDRDALQDKLAKVGISTMIYYPVPCHKLPVYKNLTSSCPLSEQAASQVISLPIWPSLERSVQQASVDQLRQLGV